DGAGVDVFFSSRRRHTSSKRDWSSDVCSSDLRRHLHQHPELSLHEFETTKYIAAFLDELGVQYDRPLETGLIAYLPGNGNHTIAYRADIDALPIYEENDVSYRSETDHVMHAFGH